MVAAIGGVCIVCRDLKSGVVLVHFAPGMTEVPIRRDAHPVRFFRAILVNCLISAILIFSALVSWFNSPAMR